LTFLSWVRSGIPELDVECFHGRAACTRLRDCGNVKTGTVRSVTMTNGREEGFDSKGHIRLPFLAIFAVERGLNDPADGEWT